MAVKLNKWGFQFFFIKCPDRALVNFHTLNVTLRLPADPKDSFGGGRDDAALVELRTVKSGDEFMTYPISHI